MKHILATILLAVISLPMFAQYYDNGTVLTYEDVSRKNDLYRTNGEWAEVIIQTKNETPLQIISNVDGRITHNDQIKSDTEVGKRVSAVIYKVENNGGGLFYHILFRTDKKYNNRVLTIASPGFETFVLPLNSLSKKTRQRFRVYNPQDANDGSCFQEHFVKGNQYYAKYKYAVAQEEYKLAMQCVDATAEQKNEANQSINNCTSILAYIERGNQLVKNENYQKAAFEFQNAYNLNPQDQYLLNRYNFCSRNLSSVCSIYFAEAESSFREKDYETARDLYQAVVDNGCDTQLEATQRIEECNNLLRKRNHKASYFGLEMADDMIGFTVAGYSSHVGTYLTLRTNFDQTLDLMRSGYNVDDIAIVDLSVGLTIPLLGKKLTEKWSNNIFKGVWLNIGAGASGTNRYQFRDNIQKSSYIDMFPEKRNDLTQQHVEDFLAKYKVDHPDETNITEPSDVLKPDFGVSILGEIGVTVKVWRMALRGTYYVREPLSKVKDYRDLINTKGISFGIGYCW